MSGVRRVFINAEELEKEYFPNAFRSKEIELKEKPLEFCDRLIKKTVEENTNIRKKRIIEKI